MRQNAFQARDLWKGGAGVGETSQHLPWPPHFFFGQLLAAAGPQPTSPWGNKSTWLVAYSSQGRGTLAWL